ncbi:hypothetical protein HK098_001554 [Nowakowskiella sp. JEL0407]|nr:hypothetical protein HK098_001554 [Nowakowskiella sp. JEL0407]
MQSKPVNSLPTLVSEKGKDAWEFAWSNQISPWDLGSPTPAVADMTVLDPPPSFLPNHAKILVPGCGGGHDVIQFAKTGREAVGIDLSETAVEYAKTNLAKVDSKEFILPPKFYQCDFFADTDIGAPFDVIFDYTFLCALPISLRQDWANKMNSLLKPGGYLICLMYPLVNDDPNVGPPFPLRREIYSSLLGQTMQFMEERQVRSIPRRAGVEALSIWKKYEVQLMK